MQKTDASDRATSAVSAKSAGVISTISTDFYDVIKIPNIHSSLSADAWKGASGFNLIASNFAPSAPRDDLACRGKLLTEDIDVARHRGSTRQRVI